MDNIRRDSVKLRPKGTVAFLLSPCKGRSSARRRVQGERCGRVGECYWRSLMRRLLPEDVSGADVMAVVVIIGLSTAIWFILMAGLFWLDI